MALITSDLTFDVLICITIVTLAVYVYFTRNCNYWKKRGVKEIEPNFFFGNIGPCIFAKKNPPELLTEIYNHAEGEKMIGFHVFDKPYLMVRDPELIRHVFIKDFSNFSNKILSSSKHDVLGNKSLFLTDNPPWKHIRQRLSPIFTSGKLKKMFELMLEIREDLQDHLDNLGIDEKIGKPVEVKELCAQFTTDLIGSTAFGLKLNSLKDPNAEFRKYGREIFRSGYKRYLQLLSIFFVPDLKLLTSPEFFDKKGTSFFRDSFWYVINERKRTEIRRNDLIDSLLDMRKDQDNEASDSYKLEGDELVAQAAIFFSGGFETSSTTMTFGLYELARNPEMQTRLRNEICDGLKKTDGKLTYDMVMSLPYLNMIVHEVLRIYPVLPWLDRRTDTDYTIPGTNVIVSKGTPFILPMRMLQMDPKYYPDPEKFDPERFTDENRKNHTPFTYFPFGEGPRNCIGVRLGLLQTKLGLLHFVHRYEITPCSETPIPIKLEKLHVFLHAAGGLNLNFRKISY